ncbi:MAG: pilus assembly protein [Amylibacter sp.]|nr:pilus assembly protein [Amylibacter sp.]
MKRFLKTLRRFTRNDRGTATVEFVFVFPVMLAFIFVMFDLGLIMVKYVVLENSLDIVVREVRLHGIQGGQSGSDYFKQKVCARSPLLADCANNLFIEMTPIDIGTTFVSSAPTCVDRTVNDPPAVEFVPGVENGIVYIRACVIVDRYLPTTLLNAFALDASGGIRLIADSAYVVEP